MATALPTLQQAQAIVQISQAAGQAQGFLSSTGFTASNGAFDPMGPCRRPPNEQNEALVDEDDDAAAILASTSELQKYWFRMCVYSGENIVKEVSQVVVEIGEGTESAILVEGPTAPKSSRPVWEFFFEREIEIAADPPNVEIKVFGKSLITRSLGAAALTLPKHPTDGPKRMWLKLHNVPPDFPGFSPQPSQIQVVWQLCTTTRGEPDLIRVAEMDSMATEKKRYRINMRVLRVKLRHGKDPPVPLRVKADLLKKNPVVAADAPADTKRLLVVGQRVSETSMLTVTPDGAPPPERRPSTTEEAQPGQPSNVDVETEATWASWGRSGWSPDAIIVRETEVNLLSYVLQITLQLQEGKFLNLGMWQETVGNLLDSIDSVNQTLRFDAEVHTMKGGMVCGYARVEIDIHDGVAHKDAPPMLADTEASSGQLGNAPIPTGKSLQSIGRHRPRGSVPQPVPIRRGLLPEGVARLARTVKYYCSVYIDGLPMEGMDDRCDPYVRVVMGSSRAATPAKVNESSKVFFQTPIVVSCLEEDSKARIEVWNDNTYHLPFGGVFGMDALLGEAMIYDVEPEKTYWRYLYGGALKSTRPDLAMQMTKGALQPASTYHGTVVVHFGTKPRVPADFETKITHAALPHFLTIRLYQGMYLHRYAGKAVTVLFQIAGCSMDVQPRRPRDVAHGWDQNPYLLAFPGVVSKEGFLSFVEDQETTFRGVLGSKDTKPLAYVQRTTPQEIMLNATPGDGPTHAYCYILTVGEEDQPPETFGRFRFSTDDADLDEPRWKRMRIDQSVVKLPKATYPSDLAGFLLGSVVVKATQPTNRSSSDASTLALSPHLTATLSEADGAMDSVANTNALMGNNRPDEAWLLPRTSKPTSVMCRPCTGETFIHVASKGRPEQVVCQEADDLQTLYCHIDVLCARNLAATDEDGLTDPVYEIHVGKQRFRSKVDTAKSLNPTFMRRVCIPIQVGSELERPPVIFKMLDYDSAFEGGGRISEGLSRITAKIADNLGSNPFGAGEFVNVGTVVIKQAVDLDAEDSRVSTAKLDLNKKHVAVWHALDRQAHSEFDPDEVGGCDPAWSTSPRVLLAVGFSRRKEVEGCQFTMQHAKGEKASLRKTLGAWQVPWSSSGSKDSEGSVGVSKLATGREASFKINVDLLGVRNLSEKGLELTVSSFWEETEPFGCDGANTNFEEVNKGDVSDSTQELLTLLNVKDSVGAYHIVPSKSKSKKRSPLGALDVTDFCGSRLAAPVYSVPVIDYLQRGYLTSPSRLALQKSRSRLSQGALRSPAQSTLPKDMPFVLMPDLVFQLKKKHLGNIHGSLSVPIPQLTGDSWALSCMKQATSSTDPGIKDQIKTADRIRNGVVREDAYTVCMDCFASADGYLKWNKDVMMGRGLSQQHLFSIFENDGDGKAREGEEKEKPLATHFFNPGDWMCSSEKFVDEPFDERVYPVLRCGALKPDGSGWQSTRKEGFRPLNPEEIYHDFYPFADRVLAAHENAPAEGALRVDALSSISTMHLRNRTSVAGWRAVSHLHAPEPISYRQAARGQKGAQSVSEPPSRHNLKANLHTFMRPVGHVIDPKDRDSRLLARLRVGLPEGRSDPAREEDCLNFVVFKFNRPGVVVWAPPLEQFEFHSRHMLFVVELTDGSNDVVTVNMPSFDLRFHFETIWYLRKTLVMRWRELQNRIERERSSKARMKGQADSKVPTVVPPPPAPVPQPMDLEKGSAAPSLDADDAEAIVLADDYDLEQEREVDADFVPMNFFDGYSRSIHVKKYAFVCRLTKREKGLNFDRTQTKNWYRAELGGSFKEIAALAKDPENDLSHVKAFFLDRFMNLRQPLYIGENSKTNGLLKGHVTVTPVETDADRPAIVSTRADRFRPMDNLWIRKPVTLNLYVLTARNIKLYGIAKTSFKPYLVIEVLGTEHTMTTEPKEQLPVQDGSVDFYIHFSANVVVPGATTLRIRMYNSRSLLVDQLLGECLIDVEDRVYSLVQLVVRQETDMEYRAKLVQPSSAFSIEKPDKGVMSATRTWAPHRKIRQNGLEDAGDAYQQVSMDGMKTLLLKPHLPPRPPAPIEAFDLRRKDEDTTADITVGALRFWLDVTPTDERYVEAQLQDTSQIDFRIIITIWDVMNISIFRDYGERNDVFVQVTLRLKDITGKVETQEWTTTVHKWAHREASFNERKAFKVKAPVVSCTVHLLLLDDDLITHNDPIYDSKVLSLDHMLMLAFTNQKEGKDSLGVNQEEVIFDSWPDSKDDAQMREALELGTTGKAWNCLKRRFQPKVIGPEPATLRMDVQILPEVEAQAVQDGVIMAPKNRLTWETAMQNPKRFIIALFGPTCVRRTMLLSCTTCTTIVLLALFALAFFLADTVTNLKDLF